MPNIISLNSHIQYHLGSEMTFQICAIPQYKECCGAQELEKTLMKHLYKFQNPHTKILSFIYSKASMMMVLTPPLEKLCMEYITQKLHWCNKGDLQTLVVGNILYGGSVDLNKCEVSNEGFQVFYVVMDHLHSEGGMWDKYLYRSHVPNNPSSPARIPPY